MCIICEEKDLSDLTEIECTNCQKLRKLPETLVSLKVLRITNCDNLKELPDNLPSLKSLYLSGLGRLKIIKKLPSTLETIMIDECENRIELTYIPPSLRVLVVELSNLSKISDVLPSTLEVFRIDGWNGTFNNLKLSNLSALTELELSFVDIIKIPIITEPIESIRIYCLKNLFELQDSFPSTLKKLEITDCPKLRKLPKITSEKMDSIIITNCHNITDIYFLPSFECEKFICNRNDKLISLFNIPLSLNTFYCFGNPKLLKSPENMYVIDDFVFRENGFFWNDQNNTEPIIKLKKLMIKKIQRRRKVVFKKLFKTPLCRDMCNLIVDFLYTE